MWSVQRRADVVWRTAPGFLVVAAPAGELSVVTGPGAEVWELLAEPIEFDEAVRVLGERFGVEVEVVRRDLESFVESMIAKGYVDRGR